MSRPPLLPRCAPRAARLRSARVLVAVLYRQAGLIAACLLVGTAASLALTLQQPRTDASTAEATVPAVRQGSASVRSGGAPGRDIPGAGPGNRESEAGTMSRLIEHKLALKLDLNPGLAVPPGGSRSVSFASQARTLQGKLDQIDLYLHRYPTEAGSRLIIGSPDRPTVVAGMYGRFIDWLGPLAGLLSGLLMAARRELGGDRMRSPREAERALGAPVLGAIPTLSVKARAACFGHPMGVQNA
jgi:hypothetical protein